MSRIQPVLALLCCVGPAFAGCATPRSIRTDVVPRPRAIIDLSQVITEDLPVRVWGHKALSDFGFSDTTEFRIVTTDQPTYVSNSYWTLFNHGGVHVDAPNHLERGAGGIDASPLESFVGPIRVLDFRSRLRDEPIALAEIETHEIRPGDVVIVLTGYDPPTGLDELPSYGFLSPEAAQHLAGIPIRAFGTDGLSVDSFRRIYDLMGQGVTGYESILPVHFAFLPQGIPVIEGLVNVESLLDEQNAIFVGLPLKVKDGDASPIRATAFIY